LGVIGNDAVALAPTPFEAGSRVKQHHSGQTFVSLFFERPDIR
jgi:hypothetical protein